MSVFFRFPDVASGQCPQNHKIETLIAPNVRKMRESRHWSSPTSTKFRKADVDCNQRPQNHKKRTLAAINVPKNRRNRRWPGPRSEKLPGLQVSIHKDKDMNSGLLSIGNAAAGYANCGN